jgi:hypothetical protein
MSSRVVKLRRPDHCAGCAARLAVGTSAHWDTAARTVTCTHCFAAPGGTAEAAAINRGTAGASAAREHERRKHNRAQRTRDAHPHLGDLLLTIRNEPQHEVAFQRGAEGEVAVAESLEHRTAASATVLLHDRRMPRGQIDHIGIAPTGVYVIDAKDWKGKVRVARRSSASPSCSSQAVTAPNSSTASTARCAPCAQRWPEPRWTGQYTAYSASPKPICLYLARPRCALTFCSIAEPWRNDSAPTARSQPARSTRFLAASPALSRRPDGPG